MTNTAPPAAHCSTHCGRRRCKRTQHRNLLLFHEPIRKIEHLFIPALRLCFVTSNSYHPIQFSGQRTIHCTRFCNKEGLKLRRKRLHFNKRAVDELFAQASSIQKEAKECHDALEQYYIDAVDFTFWKRLINICLPHFEQRPLFSKPPYTHLKRRKTNAPAMHARAFVLAYSRLPAF